MEPFNTPLKIREISLPHRAVFGPMAGFTDAPARRLMAQHGAGFTVSEMVSSRALVYGDHKTVSLLKAEPNGAPYGVQIFGEVPEIMGIDPSIIAAVKDAVHVPVLGNGDIRTAEDAVRMVEETGCDGVMIARAALGDPWLFERVNAALEGLPAPKEPNLQARMNALRRQVEEMVEQKGEFVAMPQARAQTMHYMKGLKGAASLRRYCCELSRLSDLDTLIDAVFEQQRRAVQDPDDTREVPFP